MLEFDPCLLPFKNNPNTARSQILNTGNHIELFLSSVQEERSIKETNEKGYFLSDSALHPYSRKDLLMKRNLVTPFDLQRPLQIRIANTATQAERWKRAGYCPIECSFGPISVVDDSNLDHHGSLSNLEGVAIRAYRDQYGTRRDDPRFVVTGFPDEDACFSIASKTGLIPHPSLADRFENAPPAMLRVARQNLLHVAQEINRVDVQPDLAITLVDTYFGRVVLSWRQQAHPTCRDLLSWYGGVDRWRALLTAQADDLINVAADAQADRLDEARSARSVEVSRRVVVVDFSSLGPNSTYYRTWLTRYPVLVAFIGGPSGFGTCSFVVESMAVAKELFGPDGLLSIYSSLQPGGCGGRETIGGSNRTSFVDWDAAENFGVQINSQIRASTN